MTLSLIISLIATFRPPSNCNCQHIPFIGNFREYTITGEENVMSGPLWSGLHPSESAVPPEISAAHLQLNRTPIPKSRLEFSPALVCTDPNPFLSTADELAQ
jgi:hypothetical protein